MASIKAPAMAIKTTVEISKEAAIIRPTAMSATISASTSGFRRPSRSLALPIRFDPIYVGHFKTNVRRIADYANLGPYLRDLYQQPGIAETVRVDEMKIHYYTTHPQLNPSRIIPAGPVLDWERPHGREDLV